MQIKMTLSFHFTAPRWAKNKTQLPGDSGKIVKKEENSSIPAGTEVGKTTLEIIWINALWLRDKNILEFINSANH